uniref:Aminotransferase-like plant mobile domain-containing protein n=1 Tax=Hordeum vulgare subsp. vulgare TaxID=112509 RepID=A0A8I6Y4I7_HORVV
MDRVDVENSIINLESQGMLELTDNQLHYVFGIPIGEHTILSEGVEPLDACVEFTRVAAGISDKGTHSLKASEEYLNRDITADSRKIDKDCFKIAFVIFVVGHALAPSAKHDYIKIDFWSALNDVTKIKEWNWCRYLLSHLFQAVRKFKSDVLRRPPTIHIVGYHLFLQVLVLDSLDLDVNSKPQGVYPRFALFDYDSMKKMVDAISVNMGGGEISYHCSSVRREQNVSKELVCVDDPANNFPRPTPTPKRAQFTSAPAKRASYIKTGPLEFANHIRTKYPTISGEKLDGIELHQQLAGIDELSHEVGAIIFRRFGQMDKFYNKDTTTMIWRKFLEPDFATAVLSNADPLTIQSIRTSFTDGVADLNPASSRLWHIPAILPDGWALYSFDMLKRRIVVLDPAVGPFGFSNRQVNMHTYVSDKLHSALFRCLQIMFESWHCSCGEWTRSFPVPMIENMEKYNYGARTTFLAWNFNGEKFQIPVTKDNLERHKDWLLYEVMRTDGNESMIPSDAIEAIKGSFLAL